MVAILLGHHFLVYPERLQDFKKARSRAADLKGPNEVAPIQGIVRLT